VKPDSRSWLTDRRTIVFGIGCALAGFLIALLLFEKPWHLPPNWGDIPTWLAVLIASVGGWIALSQLRQQQDVIAADIERSQKRDNLLDLQLRELDGRERARQREQAEQVGLRPRSVMAAGAEVLGSCRIVNDSMRPIRRIACRLILAGRELPVDGFGSVIALRGPRGIAGETSVAPADGAVDAVAGVYLDLLATEKIIARFKVPPEITSYETATYVIRFTDDAEKRWELNGDMRLQPSPDDNW
jgi:hypothetical protein